MVVDSVLYGMILRIRCEKTFHSVCLFVSKRDLVMMSARLAAEARCFINSNGPNRRASKWADKILRLVVKEKVNRDKINELLSAANSFKGSKRAIECIYSCAECVLSVNQPSIIVAGHLFDCASELSRLHRDGWEKVRRVVVDMFCEEEGVDVSYMRSLAVSESFKDL